MEGSSPLAFARPSAMPPSWQYQQHNDQPPYTYNPSLLGPSGYMPQSFNFREMSVRRPRSDYFSCKPIRGSSPTSGLAVDLAENFHIDSRPTAAPTPRRSLFTNGIINLRDAAITPPIPSSSPGPDMSEMSIDGTPLPHKKPHAPVFQIDSCPTPDITPLIDESEIPEEPPSSVLSSIALARTLSQPAPVLPPLAARPKLPLLSAAPRPVLRKHASSNNLPPRSSSLQAPFQFSSYSRPTLESFVESPHVEKPLASAPLPAAGIPMMLNFSQNGSPSGPPSRPASRLARKAFRRTQSMQVPHAAKPMRQDKRSCTDSSRASSVSLELEECSRPRLPHFMSIDDADNLPRITHQTFIDVLNGVYDDNGEKPVIVDCRFEYEFEGGHIADAVNYNDKQKLAETLFDCATAGGKTLIFHCEYSAHRAPLMAKFIRQHDRNVNLEHYPRLSYPEVYILDGGYSAFFKSYPSHCLGSYVEMNAAEHENACERGLAQVKRTRAKLSRAQTYAFGQGQNASVFSKAAGVAVNHATRLQALQQTGSSTSSIAPSYNGSPIGMGSYASAMLGNTTTHGSSVFGSSSIFGSSMLDSSPSVSIDAMDIDFSSPVQQATETLSRRLSVPKRFDSY